jgi:hypothetical protein
MAFRSGHPDTARGLPFGWQPNIWATVGEIALGDEPVAVALIRRHPPVEHGEIHGAVAGGVVVAVGQPPRHRRQRQGRAAHACPSSAAAQPMPWRMRATLAAVSGHIVSIAANIVSGSS